MIKKEKDMKHGLAKVAKEYGDLGKVAVSWGNIGDTMLGAAGAGVALAGVSHGEKFIGKMMDKSKFADVISYAKQKHPELRNTPDKQMNEWMKAFYSLAPSISTNKELGASMLLMAKNYGGHIDMATAKLIAETGHKSGNGSGHGEAMINFMATGRSMTKSK